LRKKNGDFGDFDNDNLTSAKKSLEYYESRLKIIKSLLDNNDNELNSLIDDLIGKVERIEAKEPNSPLLFPKVNELKELKDKYKLEFDEYYKEYNKSFPGGNYLNTKLINHKYSRKFGQKLQKVNSHNITKRKMYM
jgi:DNA repair ATPase RecN